MDKTCDTCFYRNSEQAQPCNACSVDYDKWVAVNFLSEVDEIIANSTFDAEPTQGMWVMDKMAGELIRIQPSQDSSPLNKQVSGDHYKGLKIQPIEYLHANNIPFAEGCAIKYLTRWRDKGGVSDLEKAKHFIELLIELETRASP